MQLTALYNLPIGRYFLQLDDQDYKCLRKLLNFTKGECTLFTPHKEIIIAKDIDNKILIHKFIPSKDVTFLLSTLIDNLLSESPCKKILLSSYNLSLTKKEKELVNNCLGDCVIAGNSYKITKSSYIVQKVECTTIVMQSHRNRPYISINDATPILYSDKLILPCVKQYPINVLKGITFYSYINNSNKNVYSTDLTLKFIRNWIKSGYSTLTKIEIDNSLYNLGVPIKCTTLVKNIGGKPIVSVNITNQEHRLIINCLLDIHTYESKLIKKAYNSLFDLSISECEALLNDYNTKIRNVLIENEYNILHKLCVHCNLIRENDYTKIDDLSNLKIILDEYVKSHTEQTPNFSVYEYLPSMKIRYIIKNLSSKLDTCVLHDIYKCNDNCTINIDLPINCKCNLIKPLNTIIKEVLSENNINMNVIVSNSSDVFTIGGN